MSESCPFRRFISSSESGSKISTKESSHTLSSLFSRELFPSEDMASPNTFFLSCPSWRGPPFPQILTLNYIYPVAGLLQLSHSLSVTSARRWSSLPRKGATTRYSAHARSYTRSQQDRTPTNA